MKRHPLEELLNADADDIMAAIMGGFRAIIDVKGKLAEYFLNQKLEELKKAGEISDFQWNDKDGLPDFTVQVDQKTIVLECKNVRTPTTKKRDVAKVELQKTRNSKDGSNTRGYKCTGFDMIAACLFNQIGEWRFLYSASGDLLTRDDDPDFLKVMQPVPLEAQGVWSGDLLGTLRKVAEAKPTDTLL